MALLKVLLGPEGRRQLEMRRMANEQLFENYDNELVLRLHNVKNLRDTRIILGKFKEQLDNQPPTAQKAKNFLAPYAQKQPRTLYRYTQMVKGFMK